MKKFLFAALILAMGACTQPQENESIESRHLKNIRQLTFGGNNAEAYFSRDSRFVSFQSDNPAWGLECDQIFMMDIEKGIVDQNLGPDLISTGLGRTTCAFFMPDGEHILYASTHEDSDFCPVVPPKGDKYLWPIYDAYDIYVADLKGNIVNKLTDDDSYNAEATISPDGKKIVFTSTKNGDLDLYTMDIDGSNVQQVTFDLGYNGGAFFSPDSKKLVFRASRPQTEEEIAEYKGWLEQGLVAPTNMELFTCNVDGSDMKQITNLGKASWAPYFTPKGDKIVFSSNHHSEDGYDFQLYMINIDGTGLEQITTESYFNSFPMFSYDGKKIIFSSNRDNGGGSDTNIFIADWVD